MKAKELALKYLSLRDRTIWELRKHLIEKEQKPEDVEATIQDLLKAGYIDDKKYAINYIIYGRSKNRGQIRITKELLGKGVKEETVLEALNFIEDEESLYKDNIFSERKRAEELALNWVKAKEIDDKLLGKIARKLEALGYEGETIYGVIGLLMSTRSDNNGID